MQFSHRRPHVGDRYFKDVKTESEAEANLWAQMLQQMARFQASSPAAPPQRAASEKRRAGAAGPLQLIPTIEITVCWNNIMDGQIVGDNQTFVRVPIGCTVGDAKALIATELVAAHDPNFQVKDRHLTMTRHSAKGAKKDTWTEGMEWHGDDQTILTGNRVVFAMPRPQGG